mgnify:CR=1 FL=1
MDGASGLNTGASRMWTNQHGQPAPPARWKCDARRPWRHRARRRLPQDLQRHAVLDTAPGVQELALRPELALQALRPLDVAEPACGARVLVEGSNCGREALGRKLRRGQYARHEIRLLTELFRERVQRISRCVRVDVDVETAG